MTSSPGPKPSAATLRIRPSRSYCRAWNGPGEAVKGDALDRRAEAGHRCATFMVLVSCSSMCSDAVVGDDVGDVEHQVHPDLVLGPAVRDGKVAREDGRVEREPPFAGFVHEFVEAERAVVHGPAQRALGGGDAVDCQCRAGDAGTRQGPVPGDADFDGGAAVLGA